MAKQASALLIVEKGAEDASVIPLDQERHIIGKFSAADIPLANPYVSRQHAQILLDNGNYRISDLGSKNGTYVNGVRLTSEARVLNSGDRIELGEDQVVLRFQTWSSTLTLPASGAPAGSKGVAMDARSREVWVDGVLLGPRLSRKEFDVLDILYRRKGAVCSKDQIAAHAWSERSQGDVGDQEIEQCIRRLRLRVEVDPSQPSYVLNVRGSGYKFAGD